MTLDEWFDTHKTVSDFTDGETVYLFVDGIGEVETTYSQSDGELRDVKTGTSYGTLAWWLNLTPETPGMNGISCPPELI
jgi:hypothetical protein